MYNEQELLKRNQIRASIKYLQHEIELATERMELMKAVLKQLIKEVGVPDESI